MVEKWNKESANKYITENYPEITFLDYKEEIIKSRKRKFVLIKYPDEDVKWINTDTIKHIDIKNSFKKWTKDRAMEHIKNIGILGEIIDTYSSNEATIFLFKDLNGYLYEFDNVNLLYGKIPHKTCGKFKEYNYKLLIKNNLNLTFLPCQKFLDIHIKYYAYDDFGYVYPINCVTIHKNNLKECVRFRKDNLYSFYNINLWLKLNLPEYICVTKDISYIEKEIEFKYIGDNWKFSKKDRIFKSNFRDIRLYNKRHPYFNKSLMEIKIKEYLLNKDIKFKEQFEINECKSKRNLKFDFAILDKDEKLKCLIEYNGELHYNFKEYFHTYEDFIEGKKIDTIKVNFCKNNNIKLFIIKYTESKNLLEILEKIINEVVYNG